VELVEELLETLATLGKARAVDEHRYIAAWVTFSMLK
jgi:hypothetical protein